MKTLDLYLNEQLKNEEFRKEWEEMVSVYRFVTKEENRHE